MTVSENMAKSAVLTLFLQIVKRNKYHRPKTLAKLYLVRVNKCFMPFKCLENRGNNIHLTFGTQILLLIFINIKSINLLITESKGKFM